MNSKSCSVIVLCQSLSLLYLNQIKITIIILIHLYLLIGPEYLTLSAFSGLYLPGGGTHLNLFAAFSVKVVLGDLSNATESSLGDPDKL